MQVPDLRECGMQKVMEVVAQRDKEDGEIMDELAKFDPEMHQQLLELVRTVSSSAQPRMSYSNPSRSNSAASEALTSLFNAARNTNNVNISAAIGGQETHEQRCDPGPWRLLILMAVASAAANTEPP